MTKKTECTIMELRRQGADIVARAKLARERIIITNYGKNQAAVVSLEDLAKLEEPKMVKACVFTHKAGDKYGPLTEMTFTVIPRVGEHFSRNDEKGIGQVFCVEKVIHASDTARTMGDIFAVHVDTETAFRKNIHKD